MDPRYPIGPFSVDTEVTPDKRRGWIAAIGALPAELRSAVEAAGDRLDQPYRPGGWTGRQVVHHVADSHVNAYVRFRLALTEEEPTVKPYREDRWAELIDARSEDPAVSLALLTALHQRWHRLLSSLPQSDFARTARHPEHGAITVDWLLQMYAWHGRHHIGHLGAIARGQG